MSKTRLEHKIFKQGSTTFYWSSKLFPKKVRADVFKLYSFVRVADDYVDCVPAQAEQFHALRAMWNAAKNVPDFDSTPAKNDTINQRVTKNIVFVARKYSFDQQWIEDFLNAMQADLNGKKYQTLADTLWYVHGSAEVIGLMMSRILGLSKEADEAAQLQGRAFQWINFIRDIAEDNALGRSYFPKEDLKKFGLKNLHEQTARANPENFQKFIHFEIDRYQAWQAAAQAGYSFIPKRINISIQTATKLYAWTANQILQDVAVIFRQKIKPSKSRILRMLLTHWR